jgi:hypothetical protein
VGCNTQCIEATLGISLYSYLYLKLGRGKKEQVAQTMYIHVSKCENNERKDKKKNLTFHFEK